MQLIDTHCHLDNKIFTQDLQNILKRSREAGITRFILPGVEQSGWQHLLQLCNKEKGLYPALGLHPMFMEHHLLEHLQELKEYASQGRLLAIGEIGLDYHINDNKLEQQILFENQIAIAKEVNLPVLLHVRKAHDQVISTLKRLCFKQRGIVHAFNGSLQQAEKYLELGFLLGFGGTLTYDRAKKIRAIAQQLPLPAIVLETDAPDMPPLSRQGTRNSPEFLPEILLTLAKLRPETIEKIVSQTSQNATSLFDFHTFNSL